MARFSTVFLTEPVISIQKNLTMQPDGRKIVKDLILHRHLWQVVLSESSSEGKENLVKLRQLESGLGTGVICIGIKKNRKKDFERLAEKWNPLAIEFLPMYGPENDELLAELSFE